MQWVRNALSRPTGKYCGVAICYSSEVLLTPPHTHPPPSPCCISGRATTNTNTQAPHKQNTVVYVCRSHLHTPPPRSCCIHFRTHHASQTNKQTNKKKNSFTNTKSGFIPHRKTDYLFKVTDNCQQTIMNVLSSM